jgi:hypothetical protein
MTDKELIQNLIKRGVTLEAILNEILPLLNAGEIEDMRRWVNSFLVEKTITSRRWIK